MKHNLTVIRDMATARSSETYLKYKRNVNLPPVYIMNASKVSSSFHTPVTSLPENNPTLI